MSHPLDASYSKIERAEAHIKELNTKVGEFFARNPYKVRSKLNEQGTEDVWSVVVEPIPAEIECIAADAVHNLRTPLDKMLAAGFRNPNIHTPTAVIQSLKMPFADHVNDAKNQLLRMEEHFTAPAIKFVADAEPYKGGAGHSLWAINKLDNRDKHRALLEPILPVFSSTAVRNLQFNDGSLIRIGSTRGKHMFSQFDPVEGRWMLVAPTDEARPIYQLAPATMSDYFLEFHSPHDDMEVAATMPNTKLKADIKPTLSIAFSDIEGFEGEPVIKALQQMRETVLVSLREFQNRFF